VTADLKLVTSEVDELVREIRPLLRQHHRKVQWAALAQLMAMWLIEHAAVRSVILEPLLRVHCNTIRKLVDGIITEHREGREP